MSEPKLMLMLNFISPIIRRVHFFSEKKRKKHIIKDICSIMAKQKFKGPNIKRLLYLNNIRWKKLVLFQINTVYSSERRIHWEQLIQSQN